MKRIEIFFEIYNIILILIPFIFINKKQFIFPHQFSEMKYSIFCE